ncbi:olfactory receptor 10A4-like [Carettochelys insculpta]|uniref:olfactory receptor 10A4-like n=1 Tax=Carettochelys insculpta TaxID=44489 RepID=UPI003EC10AB5
MTNLESRSAENQTFSDHFILVGFSYLNKLQILLFLVFSVIYLFTVMGNLFIILLIKVNSSLQTPMYFFVVNLSFSEMCYTTSVFPQLLIHLVVEEKTISIAGCAAQMYIYFIMGLTACCLLAAMAYDRYVAICHPLHYTTILSGRTCVQLAGASWMIGILVAGAQTTLLFSQPFCGSNRVHHYYCDSQTVEKMLCNYSWKNVLVSLCMMVLFVMGPFLLIILSYIGIISTILKVSSVEGRHKAFSTCSSHLAVVTLIYGTGLLGNLIHTPSSTSDNSHLISLPYMVLTPMLNPIIYALRNKDVHGAFRNTIGKVIFSHKRRC